MHFEHIISSRAIPAHRNGPLFAKCAIEFPLWSIGAGDASSENSRPFAKARRCLIRPLPPHPPGDRADG
jgi:hypothetical protein